MALVIRPYDELIPFNLYSVVETILAGTMSAHDSIWTGVNLEAPDDLLVSVIGSDFQLDGDNRLTAGTVTSLSIGIAFVGGFEISGFTLDIAAAKLAPPGTYPLVVNPTVDYSAASFHPGYDTYGQLLTSGVSFTSGAGNDTLRGSDFADELDGSAGNDRIGGAKGDDWIYGGFGKDTMDGGQGYDFVDFSAFTKSVAVKLKGSTAAVVKVAGLDQDLVSRIEGIIGSTRNDTLTGDGAANRFVGLGGKDTLDGGGEYDSVYYTEQTKSVSVTLNGSTFAPVTVGGAVEDTIRNFENVFGGTAADRLIGDSRHNALVGLGGRDSLSGNGGNDVLDGGAGIDTLRGGDGYDRFFFQHVGSSNADVVLDFKSGTDVIVLDINAFKVFRTPRFIHEEEFRVGSSAKDADDVLIYDRPTGRLWYDRDGVGGHAQQLILTFADPPRTLDYYSGFLLVD